MVYRAVFGLVLRELARKVLLRILAANDKDDDNEESNSKEPADDAAGNAAAVAALSVSTAHAAAAAYAWRRAYAACRGERRAARAVVRFHVARFQIRYQGLHARVAVKCGHTGNGGGKSDIASHVKAVGNLDITRSTPARCQLNDRSNSDVAAKNSRDGSLEQRCAVLKLSSRCTREDNGRADRVRALNGNVETALHACGSAQEKCTTAVVRRKVTATRVDATFVKGSLEQVK